MFKTQYNFRTKDIFTPSGDRYYHEYEPHFDEKGNFFLKLSDKIVDTYAMIQSSADSVDIHVLMSRFEHGEFDILNRGNAVYFDATVFPKTFAEMYESVKNAEDFFLKLKPDVREAFKNSPSVFYASLGDGSYKAIFEKFNVKNEPVEVESQGGVQNEQK